MSFLHVYSAFNFCQTLASGQAINLLSFFSFVTPMKRSATISAFAVLLTGRGREELPGEQRLLILSIRQPWRSYTRLLLFEN